MKPNERFTEVTINERRFQIGKFDALTGSFMAVKLAGMIAPLVKSINVDAVRGAEKLEDVKMSSFDITGILSAIGSLTEEDFAYVQGKCLRVCREILPGDLAPVIRADGSFGVTDLDDDTATVMALTVHALMFNIKSFFGASPLASLVGGLLTTSPRG